MIRYADDLVILCHPGEGGGIKARLDRWLRSHGLTLNEKKTRVLESHENGFEFLGFSFRWQHSQKGTLYVHTEPSPAAEQELRNRIRELTRRSTTWKEYAAAVREINRVTRGWGNYFALAHYHRSFKQMNYFVAHRLRQWLWRKHGNAIGKYSRWPDCALFAPMGFSDYRHIWNRISHLLRNSESRMRENRPSGLMRGGAQAVIGICLSTRRPRLLYTPMARSPSGARRDAYRASRIANDTRICGIGDQSPRVRLYWIWTQKEQTRQSADVDGPIIWEERSQGSRLVLPAPKRAIRAVSVHELSIRDGSLPSFAERRGWVLILLRIFFIGIVIPVDLMTV